MASSDNVLSHNVCGDDHHLVGDPQDGRDGADGRVWVELAHRLKRRTLLLAIVALQNHRDRGA